MVNTEVAMDIQQAVWIIIRIRFKVRELEDQMT